MCRESPGEREKEERGKRMATKSTPSDAESTKLVAQMKHDLAEVFGMPIIGTGDYFTDPNHEVNSSNLRDLQLFVNAIVSNHDTLADETGHDRLVGKRGRKSGDTKKPETAADVLKKLSR